MQRFSMVLFAAAATLLLAMPRITLSDTIKTQPRQTDVDALIAALRTSGLGPRQVDHITNSFFTVPATVYAIRGGELQVYEYPNEDLAARDAAQVSATGSSIGTSKPFWIAPPHFFRRRQIMVLYLGSDAHTLDVLRAKIGPQFAGR